MLRVKVCGITNVLDVERCVGAGVDALGFIFAPSPRRVTVDQAVALTGVVPPFVTCVGVFAGNPTAEVAQALGRCRLDVLQFSGDEPPQFCASFGMPVIKVIRLPSSAARQAILSESLREARAIAVMVDARMKDSAGGAKSGVPLCDAAELRRASRAPFILSGGLRPDNVAAAVAAVRPWAVDVRSGVERDDRKDPGLLARFVREARNASDRIPGRSLGGI